MEMKKKQSNDKLSKSIDKSTKTDNDEELNKVETEKKDTEQKVIQQTENMDMVHIKRPTQSQQIKHQTEMSSAGKENIIMTR